MNAAPRVSILTLAYNKGPYVAQCLESVLAQTYDDWELVFVDDGSNDDAFDTAEAFARRDPRVRAYRKPNGGLRALAATHNYALERSRGSLIAILDADDYWPPDKLEAQVRAHDAPDVIMSYGQFVLVTPTAERLGPVPPFTGAIATTAFLRHLLLHRSYMINVTLMIARDALERVGGFQQDGSLCADMATGLRLAALDGRVHYEPRPLGYWRQQPGQFTRSHGAFVGEYNLTLSLKTLLDLPPERRRDVGVAAGDIIDARRAMIADAYFQAARAALQRGDRADVDAAARELWRWGGAKRRAQAVYARLAAPLGLNFEPVLRAVDALSRRSRA